MKGLLLFTLLFSLTSTESFSAKNPDSHIRKSLSSEKQKLSRISKEIAKVEGELEKLNKKIIRLGSSKNSLEKSLYELKKELLTSMTNLNHGKLEVKGLLTSIAVNTMGNDEGPAQIMAQKILVKELKGRLAKYNRQILETKKQQKRLNELEQDYKIYETKERMLLETIANLEESKRAQAEEYIQTKNNYQKVLKKWEGLKVKRTKNKKGESLRQELGVFLPPLEHHTSIDFKKKGVTFLFKGRQPVLSPRPGKVIHRGQLSTYGNVVMIDHGQETISVCLGDFDPKIVKGATVKKGQVLGYTLDKKRGTPSKLYFEVRKKDKAQATIHLLDDKALARAASWKENS